MGLRLAAPGRGPGLAGGWDSRGPGHTALAGMHLNSRACGRGRGRQTLWASSWDARHPTLGLLSPLRSSHHGHVLRAKSAFSNQSGPEQRGQACGAPTRWGSRTLRAGSASPFGLHRCPSSRNPGHGRHSAARLVGLMAPGTLGEFLGCPALDTGLTVATPQLASWACALGGVRIAIRRPWRWTASAARRSVRSHDKAPKGALRKRSSCSAPCDSEAGTARLHPHPGRVLGSIVVLAPLRSSHQWRSSGLEFASTL